jgi:hypothetical protein
MMEAENIKKNWNKSMIPILWVFDIRRTISISRRTLRLSQLITGINEIP